jgi:hypothetical protein
MQSRAIGLLLLLGLAMPLGGCELGGGGEETEEPEGGEED